MRRQTRSWTGFAGVLQADGYQAYASFAKITRALSVSDALRTHAAASHEALDPAPVAAGFMLAPGIGNLYVSVRPSTPL